MNVFLYSIHSPEMIYGIIIATACIYFSIAKRTRHSLPRSDERL